METREHVPWIASMLATAVAFMSLRHRSSLLIDTQLRRVTGILLAVPALYAPGGCDGSDEARCTPLAGFAWGVLHLRWKAREVDTGRIYPAMLILIALGILGTFPPVSKLFQAVEWPLAFRRPGVLWRAGTPRPDRRRPPRR